MGPLECHSQHGSAAKAEFLSGERGSGVGDYVDGMERLPGGTIGESTESQQRTSTGANHSPAAPSARVMYRLTSNSCRSLRPLVSAAAIALPKLSSASGSP